MTVRLVGVVLLLVVGSAAVGALAAVLLQPDSPAPLPSPLGEAAVVEQAEPPAAVPASPQPASQPAASGAASGTDSGTDSGVIEEAAEDAAAPLEPQPASVEAEAAPPPSEPEAQAVAVEPEPEPEPEPVIPIEAALTPDILTQGEAFSVIVEHPAAAAASVSVADRSWALTQIAPGRFWGVAAVPRDWPSGAVDVLILVQDADGSALGLVTRPLLVLASTAPLEAIVLGGTGEPADPALVAEDVAVRFAQHVAVTGPPRWTGAWRLPAAGEVSGVFGAPRSYDGVLSDQWHHGHDIAANQGDPIVAPAAGTVAWAGTILLHGTGVILDHGAGVYSGYWHMSLIAVNVGAEVAAGDWLGNIGNTGLSTGPHLHWEVIVQGVDVDPVQWLGSDQPPLPPEFLPTEAEVEEAAEAAGAAEAVDTLAE